MSQETQWRQVTQIFTNFSQLNLQPYEAAPGAAALGFARRCKSNEQVSNVRGRGARNDGRNGPKQHEIYRRNQLAFETMFSNNDNSDRKFFVITPDNGENLCDAITIKANQDLEIKLGVEPKRVAELWSGALLVEVQNEQQSMKIKTINELHTINIIATELSTRNKSNTTIYYKNKPQFTVLEILSELTKFNVTNILCLKTNQFTQIYTSWHLTPIKYPLR